MDIWETQKRLLGESVKSRQNHARRLAVKTLTAIERNSAAYQADAKRNGELQPMLIVRMKPTECRITLFPDMQLFTGDYVDCFSDRWLVTEVFTDENTNRFAKALLCNHMFKFQNGTADIIKRLGVISDSNHLNRNERQLPLENGWYQGYLPLDDDTKKIFVDKRFALGTAFNNRGEQILSVIKVVWLDQTTANLSEGDSLMKLRLEIDVFNPQADNINKMICDYIPSNSSTDGDGETISLKKKQSWRTQI